MNRNSGEKVWIELSSIVISEKTEQKIMRDRTQLIEMKHAIERGRKMVDVCLRLRADGLYTIDDGRHRVLAAVLADETHIEATVK